ncbi:type II toxin-antitoxin system ParD family antitoxin [bacterium]|nr:type II toxin-antitoxin system ParD family antitoxin [bacterium]
MNISLNSHFDNLVNSLVESGQYNSASEVIRHALRLLEQENEAREIKLQYFRTEIKKGIESGDAGTWDKEDFLKRAQSKVENEEG